MTLPTQVPGITSGVTAQITDTTATEVIATPGAGKKLCVTTLVVANSDATVGTIVEIRSGSTARMRLPAAALCGGAVLQLDPPLVLAANEALNAVCLTTGAEVYVSAIAYQLASNLV